MARCEGRSRAQVRSQGERESEGLHGDKGSYSHSDEVAGTESSSRASVVGRIKKGKEGRGAGAQSTEAGRKVLDGLPSSAKGLLFEGSALPSPTPARATWKQQQVNRKGRGKGRTCPGAYPNASFESPPVHRISLHPLIPRPRAKGNGTRPPLGRLPSGPGWLASSDRFPYAGITPSQVRAV